MEVKNVSNHPNHSQKLAARIICIILAALMVGGGLVQVIASFL